jgi:hypothetical protein
MTTTNKAIVIDTETCNIIKSDKVQPGNNLTYDIGYSKIEPSTGRVLERHSYVVREIFFGERERMDSAYYANKLPQYYDDIASGKRIVKSFFEVMNEINEQCHNDNVIAVIAHNARFDVDALNTTARWLTGLDYVTALPRDVEIWDSMQMWNAVKPAKYSAFCEENGYKTNHKPPRDRLTAEIIYRFLSGEIDFEESHTALEDVEIESQIVFACYRTHKPLKEARVLYHARKA